MNYPLTFRFKILALSTQVSAIDAGGNQVFYFNQKKFRLKEHIDIYSDDTKAQLTHSIKADRVIDFSATYTLSDASGSSIGSIKRRGARSLWRASYHIELNGQPVAHVREANPWTKVLDSLLDLVPFVGIFLTILSGYFLHPEYIIESAHEGQPTLGRLVKQPALLEGIYRLEADAALGQMDTTAQHNVAILVMMVAMLERYSG